MKRFYLIGLILILALLVALPTLARAPIAPSAAYEIPWQTIDGGAMNVSGGGFSLIGTIGQADAGTLTGGSYSLAGGFWGGAILDYKIYLPLMLKSG